MVTQCFMKNLFVSVSEAKLLFSVFVHKSLTMLNDVDVKEIYPSQLTNQITSRLP